MDCSHESDSTCCSVNNCNIENALIDGDDFRELRKSTSIGNLSRITSTTAEGTDSFSIGEVDARKGTADAPGLTALQFDSSPENRVVPIDNQLVEERPQYNDMKSDPTKEKVSDSGSLFFEESDDSFGALPNGIPTEIVLLINGHAETSIQGTVLSNEVCPLNRYKTLLVSSQDKFLSMYEEYHDFHYFSQQSQGYVEDLLNQKKELEETIEDLEYDWEERNDQELFLKVVMLFSLLIYVSCGSPEFLVAAVSLQLFITLVNIVCT